MNGQLIYLIQISGNEGNGITSCCHFDETTEDSVPHWSILVHAMEQITQAEKLKYNQVLHREFLFLGKKKKQKNKTLDFMNTELSTFSCFNVCFLS